jgi:uncharacterized phage-associated protein
MPNSKQVAEYFLCLTDSDVGDLISNLKLQKLVYYAQGFHLAMFDEVLFDEPIVAWEHGPVVEQLYHYYKHFGNQAIPQPETIDDSIFTEKQIALLKEVYEVYGQFSAWKLRNMTHSEKPWIETNKNAVISTELMRDFFKNYID